MKVTLKKGGKVIEVLPNEVAGLKAAGVLKEEKGKTETKEEKNTGSTKQDAGTNTEEEAKAAAEAAAAQAEQEAAEALAAKERMKPKSNRPINISHKNIKS